MKNLHISLLIFSMLFIFSCTTDSEPETKIVSCDGNHATYTMNGTAFETMHMPDGNGEFLTPDGEICGIAAALNETANYLTMRIVDEDEELSVHVDVSVQNEELEFEFVQYTDEGADMIYNTMVDDHDNFIIITALDMVAKTIEGEFQVKLENNSGEEVNITQGTFACEFNSF